MGLESLIYLLIVLVIFGVIFAVIRQFMPRFPGDWAIGLIFFLIVLLYLVRRFL